MPADWEIQQVAYIVGQILGMDSDCVSNPAIRGGTSAPLGSLPVRFAQAAIAEASPVWFRLK